MVYDTSLAGRVRAILANRHDIEEKRMFGGLGFLLRGNMLVGIWKNDLIVRLDPSLYEQSLEEEHVRPFDITGRAMKGWIMVDPDGLVQDDALHSWVQRASQFVERLPAK